MEIAILGCGFGCALAVMTANNGHSVTLWCRNPKDAEEIDSARENKKLLPGVKIPDGVKLTSDIACVGGKDMVIFAVPSAAMRQTAQRAKPYLSDKTTVVSVAKGFDDGTLKPMSEVLGEELSNPVVVLSGPSHAEEIARAVPTTVVAASKSQKHAVFVRQTLSNDRLRIYTNSDMAGVELGGALKNVIAIAAGILDGLGGGDNAKAALITRGLNEMASLGVSRGARKQTFAGLTGIGDLFVTCTSLHSRNYRAGLLIGKGATPDEAIEQIGMTVEGYTAAKNAYEIMRESGVDMPITEQVYLILYKGKSPRVALADLMSRPFKDEQADVEHTWLD